LHDLKKTDETFQEQYHANLERYMSELEQRLEKNKQMTAAAKK